MNALIKKIACPLRDKRKLVLGTGNIKKKTFASCLAYLHHSISMFSCQVFYCQNLCGISGTILLINLFASSLSMFIKVIEPIHLVPEYISTLPSSWNSTRKFFMLTSNALCQEIAAEPNTGLELSLGSWSCRNIYPGS